MIYNDVYLQHHSHTFGIFGYTKAIVEGHAERQVKTVGQPYYQRAVHYIEYSTY